MCGMSCSCRRNTIRCGTIRRCWCWRMRACGRKRKLSFGRARSARKGSRWGRRRGMGTSRWRSIGWSRIRRSISIRRASTSRSWARCGMRADGFRSIRIACFLTGHGAGGNAAWDLALAHPDVWAGCMPFLALGDRFVTRYSANAGYLPWYFIGGELDGDKMSQNSREYDRYLRPTSDATVVEFQGRGYEPFNDELQRLFDWMGRRHREEREEF